jgi:xanthine dehydrogenase accessory factor
MKGALGLFRFLADAAEQGERTALVTITDVIGGSSRAPGTQMAVSQSGRIYGSLSGGCVETAVAGEAQRIIETGQGELIRFGAGSRFLDIRLPCGGGMDLLFTPDVPADLASEVQRRLAVREPVELRLGTNGSAGLGDSAGDTGVSSWCDETFIVRHDPELRVVIVGHGAEPVALARLAATFGAEVEVLSPDRNVLAQVATPGVMTVHLAGSTRARMISTDRHTAVVMLFHDHHWEQDFLAQVLDQDAFYIGAMGSRAAHQRRVEGLARRGVSPAALARIIGPVGLIPTARDPDTLALSILSQIADVHRIATTQTTAHDRRVIALPSHDTRISVHV